MDFETLIALAIIIGGGLISAFKKEKPINHPSKPEQPQQPQVPLHKVEPQPARPEVAQPCPVQKSESLEDALGELVAMFGGAAPVSVPKVPATPPPMPEVKKKQEMFIPMHEVPSVTPKKKSAPKQMPKAHADVPEFAKIHDIFKEGEIGDESVYEQQLGPKIFSGADDLKKAVIASEILNRKY